MRRLLLALPLCIPFYAHAQQAANPVEPFSYGVRTGTPLNPLHAVLSSVVPSAQAGSTQAASPVELFSYGRRVGTQSNPIYVNLDLSAYLTTSAAASTYLPLSGGVITNGLTVHGDLNSYTNITVMNGYVEQFWPSQTGVLGANLSASNSPYGRLSITDTGGGSGGIITGAATFTTLTGTGNAPICADASGNVFRGTSTGCN